LWHEDDGRTGASDWPSENSQGWPSANLAAWDDEPLGAGGWGNDPRASRTSKAARGGKNGKSGQGKKTPLGERIRFLLTADAWRLSVLRTWPNLLRLLLAGALLGGCAGLSLFVTRGQVGANSGIVVGSENLLQATVGPGTATPNLYDDPFTPVVQVPTPTPTPTSPPVRPTPTTGSAQLQSSLVPLSEQCTSLADRLQPVSLTLDNAKDTSAANWQLQISQGPGQNPWATPNPPATQGTVPAQGQTQITLTPDSHLCAVLSTGGRTGQYFVTVVASPGGTQTLPFTVQPASLGGSTPTPSPSPSPLPSPSPSPSPSPTP
jgi:hypothetical protein